MIGALGDLHTESVSQTLRPANSSASKKPSSALRFRCGSDRRCSQVRTWWVSCSPTRFNWIVSHAASPDASSGASARNGGFAGDRFDVTIVKDLKVFNDEPVGVVVGALGVDKVTLRQ